MELIDMAEDSCAHACSTHRYCDSCGLLVSSEGDRVLEVAEASEHLAVKLELPPGPLGYPSCGVVSDSRGLLVRTVIDAPCFGRPVLLRWRKRTGICHEPGCARRSFTEQNGQVAPSRALLSTRACWWAIGQS